MAAGSWLADRSAGTRPALANGYAALAACIVPAVPHLVWRGAAALAVSVALVACIAAVVAWLRPETGFASWAQTFGVLGARGGPRGLHVAVALANPRSGDGRRRRPRYLERPDMRYHSKSDLHDDRYWRLPVVTLTRT
jgi:hypothetical protein